MAISNVRKRALAIAHKNGWLETFMEFGLDLTEARNALGRGAIKHVSSPFLNSNKKHFRLFPDFDNWGGCTDSVHSFSNGIKAIAFWMGVDEESAAEMIVEKLNNDDFVRPSKAAEAARKRAMAEAKKAEEEKNRKEALLKIKNINLLLSNSYQDFYSIQRYMKTRGVDVPTEYLPQEVYFSKKATLFGKTYSALISLVTSKRGEIKTLHRTFLDSKFQKNKGLDNPKRLMPAPMGVDGGLIRAYPVRDRSDPFWIGGLRGFTEGLEDTIVCSMVTKVPCAAGVSATILQSADFEDNFHTGIIFADNDPAGIIGAFKLAVKLMEANKKVVVTVPPVKGKDWNDCYREFGNKAFPVFSEKPVLGSQKFSSLGCAFSNFKEFEEAYETAQDTLARLAKNANAA